MIKEKILGWLFKGYVKKLKEETEHTLELQMEAFKATLDIKDIVRARMKSVRPTHPDSNTILSDHIASLDDVGRTSFLAKAKDVTSNETFKTVVISLLVEFQQKASLFAGDMTEVNFNRASINGIQVLEEELVELTTTYYKEQEENKNMTENERLAPL
jgi:hypothetical protein